MDGGEVLSERHQRRESLNLQRICINQASFLIEWID